MNKRIKKKRWLEIKLAECLAREHLLMSAVTDQNDKIVRQAKEITDLRLIIERNAQATNSRFDKLEKQVANSNTKKSWFGRK
ncbi:hypothetical protein [Streptococcus suis]|uniref:hypothetical protein n=1 Tax=Streptococcus suis TaxID=1307 RepID=UPI0002B785A1|nr:hypothetical protein [Streptococcus suis]AGF87373.1 hypothetical protein phi30c_0029 [Streptococcus phage phi30c]QBX20951.1 hypothetical protein Javan549_0024 [Streptococcus phage Javan549]WNF72419.1 hypothetical protein RJW53_04000 [Streptococcus suis]HEL1562033.1 hypothetical protein [Streptococcus suis]HEL1663741.1 hypothetical protein [Streptococcus suis]